VSSEKVVLHSGDRGILPAMRTRHLLFAFILFVPSLCFAWGRDGHQIAAEIASRHLSTKAQACVQNLLPGQSLADVSVWADEIKGARRSTAPWHYADMAPGEKEFDLARDCPKNGCVVSAIQRYCGVLKDEKASPADRAEALKFLIHFVGDVHCPMHVAYAHDKGGIRRSKEAGFAEHLTKPVELGVLRATIDRVAGSRASSV
jgi:nuclease S1